MNSMMEDHPLFTQPMDSGELLESTPTKPVREACHPERASFSVVMSPGAWFRPPYFRLLKEALRHRVQQIIIPELAADQVGMTFDDDAATIKQAVGQAGDPAPLLGVGHSRGSEGLLRYAAHHGRERLIGVFILGSGCLHDFKWTDAFPDEPEPPRYTQACKDGIIDLGNGLSGFKQEALQSVFMSDLHPDKDHALIEELAAATGAQRSAESSSAPLPDMPKDLLIRIYLGTHDRALVLERAERMWRKWLGERAGIRYRPWDHTPWLGNPDDVANEILRVGHEALEQHKRAPKTSGLRQDRESN